MNRAPDLSIVLPAIDEAAGLRILLPRLAALFERLGARGEVIVIDGGSKDDTVAVAREHGARVERQKGNGFGSAVREGLAASAAEWVATLDADGSHAPEDIERFWKRRHDAVLIIGSRYCRGGSAEMPLSRQVLSRSLNMATRRILELPVRESSSGFRLYHGPTARAVKSDARDFTIQQDMLVGILAAGGRVVEEPIHYAPRVGGASKANAWKLLPSYVRLLWRLKALRGGWRSEAGLGAALALALASGLVGITGGLPGPGRWRALPESVRGSPVFARNLADSWRSLYLEIERSHDEMRADEPRTSVEGVVEVAPGWRFPPDALINASRALLTQSVNPDEKKTFIILSRMRPGRLEFAPLYVQYGGAFIYPFGATLGAAAALKLVQLTPELAHYLEHPEYMAQLYLVGRAYVLVFHLLGLWMVYELGRVMSGRRVAAAAAMLYAACPTILVQTHVLKPHPIAGFWFLCGTLAMLAAAEEGRPMDYFICGICAGLSCGAALTMAFGLGMPLLAWAARRDSSWPQALVGAALGLASFALTNPYLILRPHDYAWELTIYMPPRADLSARILTGAARAAARGTGPILALMAAAAIIWSARRAASWKLLAVLVVLGCLLMWARFGAWAEDAAALRFIYPLVGLACVLAADAALSLRPRLVGGIVLTALLVDTGVRGADTLLNLSLETGFSSTRSAAADWIEAHVPLGAEIGLARWPEPAHTPPFRWDRYRLVVFEDVSKLGARVPEWVVVDAAAIRTFGGWARDHYEVAADFPPARLLWAEPRDEAFFANAGMSILRRRRQKVDHLVQ